MLMKLKKNKKGFTLAELLIVIAIIAVLIAIAIPTFSASLTKAKIATEQANARSLHADCLATLLTDDALPADTTFTDTNGVLYTWAAVYDTDGTTLLSATVAVSGTKAGAEGTYSFPATLAGVSAGTFTPKT